MPEAGVYKIIGQRLPEIIFSERKARDQAEIIVQLRGEGELKQPAGEKAYGQQPGEAGQTVKRFQRKVHNIRPALKP